MTYSVGKLSKMFGISRTALLYYDEIGLLTPESRSAAGYRLYSQAEVSRLEQIMILRNAGVPIKQIKQLVAAEETMFFGKLLKRLGELNREIEKLKLYQKQIIGILGKSIVAGDLLREDSNTLEHVLRYASIASDQRDRWHSEFEAQSPELHSDFLSLLGFNEEEIHAIKGSK